MQPKKKPYDIVQNFTLENPELVIKIAIKHPEFFVDGSIAEACVNAMEHDDSFKQDMFIFVKYIGMEKRKERVLSKIK